MTKIQRIFLTLTLAAAMALPAFAYNDTVTHKQLSRIAATKTVIYKDPQILTNFNLPPINQLTFEYRGHTGNVPTGVNLFDVAGIVGEGAVDEDAGDAPANHFFDPVNNRGLSFGVSLGQRSWVWMTEPTPIDGQNYSIRDARDQVTRMLTYTEPNGVEAWKQRRTAGAVMFLTLGHVIHHMQDMAQPQHVRNDRHYDGSSGKWYLTPFINPSRYEEYTKDSNGRVTTIANGAQPIFPGSADFKTAQDFWFNGAHSGIAERVNRDFVSQGTNFMMLGTTPVPTDFSAPQPGAKTDYTPGELYAQVGAAIPDGVKAVCGATGSDCKMSMYATPVSQKASTYSIFDQDMVAHHREAQYSLPGVGVVTTGRIFDLNRFNFYDAHPVLIDRAVAYSAGIINHFLRGKLTVEPPTSGPYAVADHSAGEGFKKFKANVTNVTDNEALGGGTIRAIARFHRNGCYKPDLSGEWQVVNGQFSVPCDNWRTTEDYVVVSEEQQATFAPSEKKELTFNFPSPIPFDAIDLVVQVYYTGKVGEEAESFALGLVDTSEPTFVGIMNATDVFDLLGTFYYPDYILAHYTQLPFSNLDTDHNGIYNPPPDIRVEGEDSKIEIYIDGDKVSETPVVPQGRFTRLVVLGETDTPLEVKFHAVGAHFDITRTYYAYTKLFQAYPAQDFWRITPVDPFREVIQNVLIEFHAFAPSSMADFNQMPVSRDPDAAVPVPAQLSTTTQALRAATNSVIENTQSMGSNVVQPPPAVSIKQLPGASKEPPVHLPIEK